MTHNLLYEIPGSPRGEWDRFHVRNLGLAVNRRMAREFGGDAAKLRAASEKRVARVLGLRPDRLTAAEAAAFRELALVLDLIPDLARWSRRKRTAIVGDRPGQGPRRREPLPPPSAAARAPARRADPPRARASRQRPLRAATIWATTARAISSGERPPRSRPIGAWRRESSASVIPASSSRARRFSWVRRLPSAPT